MLAAGEREAAVGELGAQLLDVGDGVVDDAQHVRVLPPLRAQQRLVLRPLGGLLIEQSGVGGAEVAQLLLQRELLVLRVLDRVTLLGRVRLQALQLVLGAGELGGELRLLRAEVAQLRLGGLKLLLARLLIGHELLAVRVQCRDSLLQLSDLPVLLAEQQLVRRNHLCLCHFRRLHRCQCVSKLRRLQCVLDL